MPVETKFVVVRDGKELGVFSSQNEAEAFEAMSDRASRLNLVLSATVHEHNLSPEQIEAVAQTLASREKDVAAVFAQRMKPKAKAKGSKPRKAATKTAPAGMTEAS